MELGRGELCSPAYDNVIVVIFPDKHCICGYKCKTRHTSFEICRVFENCPLGYNPVETVSF